MKSTKMYLLKHLCSTLIALFLLTPKVHAQVETIKLICDVQVKNTYTSGEIEEIRDNIQVNITIMASGLKIESIPLESGFIITSIRSKIVMDAVNLSNTTQFSINAVTQFEGVVRRSSITIDRLTGRLNYVTLPDQFGQAMGRAINGTCTKFEGNRKKF